MKIDLVTLVLAGSIVAMVSGLFLLLTWYQERKYWAALWWGIADCCIGIGTGLWTFTDSFFPSHVLAPFILDVSTPLTWIAARVFNQQAIKPRLIPLVILFWCAMLACARSFGDELSSALSITTGGCLYFAAAIEFLGERDALRRGRELMFLLLCMHGVAVFLIATHLSNPILSGERPPLGLFATIHFEGLIFSVGSAICLVAMLKERSEAHHKAAALIDPLTGMANRRAFMERAQRLLDRAERDRSPIALLAFDLDKFKIINDTYGHATGDRVLQIFADVMSRVLRPADVCGRIGGEEFAAILPGCSIEAAFAIASRIRAVFQSDGIHANGQPVGATASVGIAATPNQDCSLDELMALADAALYRAKSCGRNRVVVADPQTPSAILVRIA